MAQTLSYRSPLDPQRAFGGKLYRETRYRAFDRRILHDVWIVR